MAVHFSMAVQNCVFGENAVGKFSTDDKHRILCHELKAILL